MSLPSRERGLKSVYLAFVYEPKGVAPLAGARIEISVSTQSAKEVIVAPLAGARIEMAKHMRHIK